MIFPRLEVLGPIRVSLLTNSDLIAGLATWKGHPAVFTERPVPEGARYPMVVVGPIANRSGLDDGINDHRPELTVDITVYGDKPGGNELVDTLAEIIFAHFHRARNLVVSNYQLVQIMAMGPFAAPADDEAGAARTVSINIGLRAGTV